MPLIRSRRGGTLTLATSTCIASASKVRIFSSVDVILRKRLLHSCAHSSKLSRVVGLRQERVSHFGHVKSGRVRAQHGMEGMVGVEQCDPVFHLDVRAGTELDVILQGERRRSISLA